MLQEVGAAGEDEGVESFSAIGRQGASVKVKQSGEFGIGHGKLPALVCLG
jgi:hypothetical protein